MSIACSTRQRWLISHISLMSGPIAARMVRMRRNSSLTAGWPGSASCVFISVKPLSTNRRAAVSAFVSLRPRRSEPEA